MKFKIICATAFLLASFAPLQALAVTAQPAVIVPEERATVLAIKKVLPAVVSIAVSGNREQASLNMSDGTFSTSSGQALLGSGTGFLISADGLIATNKHVIDHKASNLAYRVTLNSGKRYFAQLIGKDPLNDLAILKIFDKQLPFVELGDSRKLELGQSVVAIGNALGIYRNSVTKGVVSGLNRSIQASDGADGFETLGNVIQTDARINLGNSGGPLIDLQGRVIGVNVAMEQGAQAISFAIPINDVKPVIRSVRAEQRIVRPRLGIRFVTINEDVLAEEALPSAYGALIRGFGTTPAVTPGSPADKIGLKEHDIILEIDGQKLKDQTLFDVVQTYRPGQRIGLRILRQGKIMSRIATLDEFRPEN